MKEPKDNPPKPEKPAEPPLPQATAEFVGDAAEAVRQLKLLHRARGSCSHDWRLSRVGKQESRTGWAQRGCLVA